MPRLSESLATNVTARCQLYFIGDCQLNRFRQAHSPALWGALYVFE